jgi:hypothetical protein
MNPIPELTPACGARQNEACRARQRESRPVTGFGTSPGREGTGSGWIAVGDSERQRQVSALLFS